MHHPRPLRVALVRDAPSTPQERVHERSGPVPGRGVDHHAGRLVHHQERFVLVDDTDWNVFAGNGSLLDLGNLDPDYLARFGAIARLFAPPVDQDVALSNQRRRLRP